MKFSIQDELKKQIFAAVKTAFPDINLRLEDVELEHPAAEEHGDYSTNIALKLKRKNEQLTVDSPRKIAEAVVTACVRGPLAQGSGKPLDKVKVEVAEQGFINFTLAEDYLVSQMRQALTDGERYGGAAAAGRKIVIELVSPNINKPLHIGHLRNAALGMSLAHLYEAVGWKVIKDEINNDRGLHIMKAAYGYLLFGSKNLVETKEWKKLLCLWINDPGEWKTPSSENKKPDFFVGEYYVLGEKFLLENEELAAQHRHHDAYTKCMGVARLLQPGRRLAEKQLAEMLVAWEAEEADIWKLWQTMSAWVYAGIDQTYKRIGVVHDKKWYEHKLYKEGREVILEALGKGIFEKLPDGAVQANLEKYGLANKILVRRDGTAIYMTFDIALTKHKVEEFKADKYVWVVGNDQIDHFKRLFAVFDLLGLGKVDNFYHLAYGMVRVPGGKMSSRLGNVVLADDLLNKVKELTRKFNEETAETVAVGAIKYALLKVNPMMEVVFDPEKSVSLEGDSGPYLQYTYARAKSVLRKASVSKEDLLASQEVLLRSEELAILRYLYRFPEVVEAAARQYAPNLICTYLFELARRFNNFYNFVPILEGYRGNKGYGGTMEFRLALTEAVSIILKNGLTLLGIVALEKM